MDTLVKPGRELEGKFRSKTALIGVIGLGYVGLPICVAAAEVGSKVLGFDVDTAKADAINRGQSYLKHIPAGRIGKLVDQGLLSATTDFARLSEPDALLICVPTPTRFIELAGQINTAMPQHVINELARQLDTRTGRGLKDARILVVGVAYKKNVEDIRESPALRLMELLEGGGATVDYYDPYVPVIPDTRHYRDGRQA